MTLELEITLNWNNTSTVDSADNAGYVNTVKDAVNNSTADRITITTMALPAVQTETVKGSAINNKSDEKKCCPKLFDKDGGRCQ